MITINGNVIAENARICSSLFSKAMGLRFRRIQKNEAYVFHFKKPFRVLMDMWFVFSYIDVVFLDENKNVVEIKERFMPFAFYHSKEKVSYVIELETGSVKSNGIKFGDLMEF